MRRLRIIGAGLVLALGLAACSGYNEERGRGDAPVGSRDDSRADIVNMPDQFANVAIKCHGPNGIYTTTRQAAPVIVPNDPLCREDG